ncbi:MAG: peptide chain release factor 3 [Firmicutes bacterium]|nr:peptide chain release factor 3 [Bacillota bacterium]
MERVRGSYPRSAQEGRFILAIDIRQDIEKRRTFAIISHPDAGKTTLTEKFLLYGGAIQLAGAVKGKAAARHAVSDWMEIEKQRGISVTSSVMQFNYDGYCINILDTPGHEDFSEDTYRTLMAADSAVMVIDGSKGVEAQTRKLFKVCVMRHIPVFTFINKMDREARNPFDLMDEIETELGIHTYPMNWPIGSGKSFKGVYDREKQEIIFFTSHGGAHKAESTEVDLGDPNLDEMIGAEAHQTLSDDIELLDGANYEFDVKEVEHGNLSPVFFGSALTNFGVEPFLKEFLRLTPPPLARETSDHETVDPFNPHFSAFVFKIQANMNKAHRDRIAFMRICSGRFDKDMEVVHQQGNRRMRLSQPQQLMAQDRTVIQEAYAGDIIGVFDPGIFSIGDTVCDPAEHWRFTGIPTFAPEHFAHLRQLDTLKRKQFLKGTTQIAQEGAIQMFQDPGRGMEEIIVGVVGPLQFDVLKYRLNTEYNIEVRLEEMPQEYIRWITSKTDPESPPSLYLTTDARLIQDFSGKYMIIYSHEWSLQMLKDRNPGLELAEFGESKTL